MQSQKQRRPSMEQPRSPGKLRVANPSLDTTGSSSFPLHFLTDGQSSAAHKHSTREGHTQVDRRASLSMGARQGNGSTPMLPGCTPSTRVDGSQASREVADLRRQLAALDSSPSQVLEGSSSSPATEYSSLPGLVTRLTEIGQAELDDKGKSTTLAQVQAREERKFLNRTWNTQVAHMQTFIDAQEEELSRFRRRYRDAEHKSKIADQIIASVRRLTEENSELKKRWKESKRKLISENRELSKRMCQTEHELRQLTLENAVARANDGTSDRVAEVERDKTLMELRFLAQIALLERQLEEAKGENTRLVQALQPPPYQPYASGDPDLDRPLPAVPPGL